eukprot:SAG11_NODE_23700_length_384_cov_0.912281_1_plen_80_part_01
MYLRTYYEYPDSAKFTKSTTTVNLVFLLSHAGYMRKLVVVRYPDIVSITGGSALQCSKFPSTGGLNYPGSCYSCTVPVQL